MANQGVSQFRFLPYHWSRSFAGHGLTADGQTITAGLRLVTHTLRLKACAEILGRRGSRCRSLLTSGNCRGGSYYNALPDTSGSCRSGSYSKLMLNISSRRGSSYYNLSLNKLLQKQQWAVSSATRCTWRSGELRLRAKLRRCASASHVIGAVVQGEPCCSEPLVASTGAQQACCSEPLVTRTGTQNAAHCSRITSEGAAVM